MNNLRETAGKILDINLTTKEIRTYPVEEKVLKAYQGGGRGLNTWLLFQNTRPGLYSALDDLGDNKWLTESSKKDR